VYACLNCGHRSKYFALLPQVSDLELEATAYANVTARLAPPGKAMELREYFTMDYCNRWLALILPNGILRHPSVATKLPSDLDEQKQPMLSYRWTQRLDSLLFNAAKHSRSRRQPTEQGGPRVGNASRSTGGLWWGGFPYVSGPLNAR
jgi:hypothetical protein